MKDCPLCIIPARGGSKRFPRKNVALLAGKPLLAYAIEAAVDSKVFELVCVSSEDDEILKLARELGADVALRRPAELATDAAQVKHVCAHVLEAFESEGRPVAEFAVLLASSPLRTSEDIKGAYEIFKRGDVNYVMSLIRFSHPPQRAVWVRDGYVEPYFGIQYMRQSQLLDTLYRNDGSVIFARSEAFRREGEFYGSKVAPYFIPAERSADVDSPADLAWAEHLLSRLQADAGA